MIYLLLSVFFVGMMLLGYYMLKVIILYPPVRINPVIACLVPAEPNN